MSEIWRWSLTEQANAVSRGDVTPSELTTAALTRIEALDSRLNACVTVLDEAAEATARTATAAIAAGQRLGPLHGVARR